MSTLLARRRGARNRGLTIIEVIVALAVMAMLLALLLPAVQHARESSRRLECTSHLRQMGVAIGAFETSHRMFPPGLDRGASLHVWLLPYVDQEPLYRQYDPKLAGRSLLERTLVPLYVCPSDTASPLFSSSDGASVATTSYAGNGGTGVLRAGYDGLFRILSELGVDPQYRAGPVRPSDVTDGLSNTAAICEMRHADGTLSLLRVNWYTPKKYENPSEFEELVATCRQLPRQPQTFGWQGNAFARGMPWTDGNLGYTLYNHALPPGGTSCVNGPFVQLGIYTANSMHAGGVNLLYADGRVQFVSDSIDLDVWTALGSRGKPDIVALSHE